MMRLLDEFERSGGALLLRLLLAAVYQIVARLHGCDRVESGVLRGPNRRNFASFQG
jgi:hypothetical protein